MRHLFGLILFAALSTLTLVGPGSSPASAKTETVDTVRLRIFPKGRAVFDLHVWGRTPKQLHFMTLQGYDRLMNSCAAVGSPDTLTSTNSFDLTDSADVMIVGNYSVQPCPHPQWLPMRLMRISQSHDSLGRDRTIWRWAVGADSAYITIRLANGAPTATPQTVVDTMSAAGHTRTPAVIWTSLIALVLILLLAFFIMRQRKFKATGGEKGRDDL